MSFELDKSNAVRIGTTAVKQYLYIWTVGQVWFVLWIMFYLWLVKGFKIIHQIVFHSFQLGFMQWSKKKSACDLRPIIPMHIRLRSHRKVGRWQSYQGVSGMVTGHEEGPPRWRWNSMMKWPGIPWISWILRTGVLIEKKCQKYSKKY